ncbi:CHC2 zinc finger domain-containing protein [Bacillus wiedmannii]|uniref:CHC2 zinc finger domain-containing protein n=1 Tax=Bacillus wiedmannii TaxID=1890302 RepID=UPI0021D19CDD|nr:CHC2 zinc finger domain-containing protein [Bacillus wiedmannii]MCU5681275.1 CHC2 zinc finger domain-containing protein [Bacillus wiedmannii]
MIGIEQIKENISIVEALEQYTHVKVPNPNRRSISVRCPFHSDGSPSMAIYPNTNTFKCFTGCNDGRVGDVIDVVRLANSVDVKEAIVTLAKDFGLQNPTAEENNKLNQKRKRKKENTLVAAALNKKVIEQINNLNELAKAIRVQMQSIKTMEELEQLGEMYHLLPQIEYWLDCLVDDSDYVKIAALDEVNRLFNVLEGSES